MNCPAHSASLAILCRLALLVAIFLFGFRAKAATSGDFTYEVADDKATITRFSSSSDALTIPATLDGYPVTAIGDSAFAGCNSLTSVSIPESVTAIGEGAFEGCCSLKSLTIPASVTMIGEGAFDDCSSLAITVAPENPSYTSRDGRLLNK